MRMCVCVWKRSNSWQQCGNSNETALLYFGGKINIKIVWTNNLNLTTRWLWPEFIYLCLKASEREKKNGWAKKGRHSAISVDMLQVTSYRPSFCKCQRCNLHNSILAQEQLLHKMLGWNKTWISQSGSVQKRAPKYIYFMISPES